MRFLGVRVGKDMSLRACLLIVDLYVEYWKFIGIVLLDLYVEDWVFCCLIYM